MRFIETLSGDYIAVDTIAKLKLDSVEGTEPSFSVALETKRGEKHSAVLPADQFDSLIRGHHG